MDAIPNREWGAPTPSNLLIDCRGTVKLADFGLLVDPCGLAPNEFDIGTQSGRRLSLTGW